jgi:hypothetical protein
MPGSDLIPAELIQEVGETLLSAVHKQTNLFGIRKNCLISGRIQSLYPFKKGQYN